MQIYYAEDDVDYRNLVLDSIEEANIDCVTHQFEDGEQLMEALHARYRETGASSSPADLIILDAYMPHKDGFQVLREIKYHPHLKRIPVIMLTVDSSARSVENAYQVGANAYISKDRIDTELRAFLSALRIMWGPADAARSPGERSSASGDTVLPAGLHPVQLLVVEDDEDDANIALEMLGDRVLIDQALWVNSFAELAQYMQGEGRFADRVRYPLPDLILTDLLLPAHGGVEIIRWLKSDPVHRGVPVIAMTGSQDPELHAQALGAGAESVCGKPIRYAELVDILRVVGGMQLSIVKMRSALCASV